MRLSHIKLSGFKSFVEHTSIEVKGDRVAIIGPNGCGKSNVIDAVRWVLGESSAKNLRGESMQDVIFNGSAKRKPVSRATVELVFDNSVKRLSGLWNTYDEIAVKRLISRSGDSIYYINNQVVRKRDITDLFLGTGVGTKGYAVIEQGMISRIIESKPEELRMFLEEAAGVSKYREKRKESISRLQDTKDNLVRLEDIQGELVKQIEVLKTQAADAKHYQDLHASLKQVQLTTILVRMEKAGGVLSEIDNQVSNSQKELLNLTEKLEQEEQILEDNLVKQTKQESLLHEITMEFNTQRTELARLEERRLHSYELSQRLTKDEADLLLQNDELNLQIEDLKLQVNEMQELIVANLMTIEESQLSKQELAASFTEIEEKYHSVNTIVERISGQIIQAKHDLELSHNTKEHKKSQYNNLVNRQKKLEQEMHGLDFNSGYFELQEQIDSLIIELEQLEQQLETCKLHLHDISANYEQNNAGLASIHTEKISVESKLTTLNELVTAITTHKDIGQIIEHEKEDLAYLYQLLEVEPGYELAVEVALGSILAAGLIKDFNQVKHIPENMVALWNSRPSTSFTINPNSLANMIKPKSEQVSKVTAILNDYIIAENFDIACEFLPQLLAGQKIITCDGHLLTQDYVIFNANLTNNRLLENQSQLLALNQRTSELEIQFNIANDEKLTMKGQLDNINDEINRLNLVIKDKQQLKHKLQLEFTTHEQIYVQTKNHHEKIQQELVLLNQEIEYLQDELTELELKIVEQAQVVNDLSQQSEATNLGKLKHETNYNLAKSRLHEIDNQINQKIIDNQLLNQKITILYKNIDDKNSQIQQLDERRAKLIEELGAIEQEQHSTQIEDLSVGINELAIKIEEQNKVSAEINSKTGECRNAIIRLHKEKEAIQDKLNQLRLKEQEQLLYLHNQQEQLGSLSIEQYDKETILSTNKNNLQELQNQANNLQKQIEELGLVNLKAIEDLAEITAKNSSLLEQVSDLTEAMRQLEAAIAQIDQETRLLLDSTYSKVCETFAVYFKTLFGGGNATLELTNSDILNSGIQIFVQPPGKKNSSIHLLSGGEKALTAVSLIFAFFNLNPAPFCLLDEVDAPLDDANTARFCNLVQELSSTTQFVFISHNRLTMEMADQLIGVTMQEQGVSTTVSVSLVEAVANAS